MKLTKMALIGALTLSSTSVFAQRCNNVQVATVLTGSALDTIVQVNNTECGLGGWVCLQTEGDLTEEESDRVYTAALTAQVTGSVVSLGFSSTERGCGENANFPIVTQFIVQDGVDETLPDQINGL